MAKKILIVDDNELMIEVMTYILLNNGYEVYSLNRGDDVFNYIRTNDPDLVILDILQPAMDSSDICKLIKLNYATKDLPVIICSESEENDAGIKQKGSPDDVLYKPFGMNSLIKKVQVQLAA